ncbi:hypothetical protein BN1723_020853, partial [Verticillium longisporum]
PAPLPHPRHQHPGHAPGLWQGQRGWISREVCRGLCQGSEGSQGPGPADGRLLQRCWWS